MGHEVTVQWDRFNAVLDRRIATSSREAVVIAAEQMRGIHRQLIKITPPGHSVNGSGVEGGTAKAAEALNHDKDSKVTTKNYIAPSVVVYEPLTMDMARAGIQSKDYKPWR